MIISLVILLNQCVGLSLLLSMNVESFMKFLGVMIFNQFSNLSVGYFEAFLNVLAVLNPISMFLHTIFMFLPPIFMFLHLLFMT